MIKDMITWGRSVGLSGVDAKDISMLVRSDGEPVVRAICQEFAKELVAGSVKVGVVPVGRHAQSAERAVRTLKEGCNTLRASLESVGIEPYGIGVVCIMSHVAQAHNRYSIQPEPGSALTHDVSRPPGILTLCMSGEHLCWPRPLQAWQRRCVSVLGVLCTLVLRLAAPATLFNFGCMMGRTRSPVLPPTCGVQQAQERFIIMLRRETAMQPMPGVVLRPPQHFLVLLPHSCRGGAVQELVLFGGNTAT